MATQVTAHIVFVGKVPAAARPGAQEAFFSAVAGAVMRQVVLAHKLFATALIRAGKSVVGVNALMPSQGARSRKGLPAVFMATDKGLGACMRAEMTFQAAMVQELSVTAGLATDKQFFAGMVAQVLAQAGGLEKGFATGLVRTAQETPFAHMQRHLPLSVTLVQAVAAITGADKRALAAVGAVAVLTAIGQAGATGCCSGQALGQRQRDGALIRKFQHGVDSSMGSGGAPDRRQARCWTPVGAAVLCRLAAVSVLCLVSACRLSPLFRVMKSDMPAQVAALVEGAPTALPGAGKGPLSCMCPAVRLQVAGPAEDLFAALEKTGKGFVAGMNAFVRVQVGLLGKGACAACVRAGKGFFSGMGPVMASYHNGVCKGLATALVRAGKGLFSAMGPLMLFHVARMDKGFSTVRVRASAGPDAGMNMGVYFQGALLGKGLSTVGVGADKGLFAGMKAFVPDQVDGVCEAVPTVSVRAGEGSVAAMDALVFMQGAALCKGFATVLVRAGKGPVAAMDSLVFPQVAAPCKGEPAALEKAGPGSVVTMDPPVFLQAAAPCKSLSAVLMTAGKLSVCACFRRPLALIPIIVFMALLCRVDRPGVTAPVRGRWIEPDRVRLCPCPG